MSRTTKRKGGSLLDLLSYTDDWMNSEYGISLMRKRFPYMSDEEIRVRLTHKFHSHSRRGRTTPYSRYRRNLNKSLRMKNLMNLQLTIKYTDVEFVEVPFKKNCCHYYF